MARLQPLPQLGQAAAQPTVSIDAFTGPSRALQNVGQSIQNAGKVVNEYQQKKQRAVDVSNLAAADVRMYEELNAYQDTLPGKDYEEWETGWESYAAKAKDRIAKDLRLSEDAKLQFNQTFDRWSARSKSALGQRADDLIIERSQVRIREAAKADMELYDVIDPEAREVAMQRAKTRINQGVEALVFSPEQAEREIQRLERTQQELVMDKLTLMLNETDSISGIEEMADAVPANFSDAEKNEILLKSRRRLDEIELQRTRNGNEIIDQMQATGLDLDVSYIDQLSEDDSVNGIPKLEAQLLKNIMEQRAQEAAMEAQGVDAPVDEAEQERIETALDDAKPITREIEKLISEEMFLPALKNKSVNAQTVEDMFEEIQKYNLPSQAKVELAQSVLRARAMMYRSGDDIDLIGKWHNVDIEQTPLNNRILTEWVEDYTNATRDHNAVPPSFGRHFLEMEKQLVQDIERGKYTNPEDWELQRQAMRVSMLQLIYNVEPTNTSPARSQ